MSNDKTSAAPPLGSSATPPSPRRKRLLIGLAATCAMAAAGTGAWYWLVGRWSESTDNAYVQADVVDINAQVSGTVIAIHADDGDQVAAGKLLVKLDSDDAEVALAAARAELATTVRKVRGLYSQEVAQGNHIASAQADLAAKEALEEQARADLARRSELARNGAVSHEEVAHLKDALNTTMAATRAARASLQAIEAQHRISLAMVDETRIVTHPDVQAAGARVKAAYVNLSRMQVPAPVRGNVAKRTVQLGQRVQAGSPLMAVIPLERVWVDANFTETQIRRMKVGQAVTLTSDIYGRDVTYQGRIQSLGAGTGSAFALLPPQNATGNWIKVVQRLPVRIALNDLQQLQRYPLRVGVSMHARVDLHDDVIATKDTVAQAEQHTDVYGERLSQADALIDSIIQANLAGSKNARSAQ